MRHYSEIDIPAGKEEEFEQFLADMGGRYKGRAPLADADVQTLWNEELAIARDLVDQMGKLEPEPDIQLHGAARLIYDAFFMFVWGVEERGKVSQGFRSNINYREVWTTLRSFFQESLPEEDKMPPGVHVRKSGGTSHLVHAMLGTAPAPRDISFTIEAYGLVGMPRYYGDIAQRHHSNFGTVKQAVSKFLYTKIVRHPQIRQLVLLHP